MSEFAEGGYIGKGNNVPVTIFEGDYIIPAEFARIWGESLLKKLNETLDKNEEDGVE